MNVTVYTKPQCVQCDATKRALTSNRIEYETVDVTEDAAALAKVKALGYAQAPVVLSNQDHWSGFRPTRSRHWLPAAAPAVASRSGWIRQHPRGRIAL